MRTMGDDDGVARGDGDNVGVLLRGVSKDKRFRGMVIAEPGTITPHTGFEAEVYEIFIVEVMLPSKSYMCDLFWVLCILIGFDAC